MGGIRARCRPRSTLVKTPEIDIAEAGLALAALERQRSAPDSYHEHLAAIRAEMQKAAAEIDCNAEGDLGLFNRATLGKVLAGTFTYQGDRVTVRRPAERQPDACHRPAQGLPVALAILYIHAARSQGWPIEGVNFPGHFVVRLHKGGRAVILDPFAGGEPCTTADLRRKLKAAAGEKARAAARALRAGRQPATSCCGSRTT